MFSIKIKTNCFSRGSFQFFDCVYAFWENVVPLVPESQNWSFVHFGGNKSILDLKLVSEGWENRWLGLMVGNLRSLNNEMIIKSTFIIVNYLSHCRSVHDAIIHKETMKTNNTVPGHIVMRVLKTNLRTRKWWMNYESAAWIT